MKLAAIVLALATLTACAHPGETPEQFQARMQAAASFGANLRPQAPLVIHCLGCR